MEHYAPHKRRVAQEVYEPLIGVHYPMLCNAKKDNWQIGTGSIRAEGRLASGFRFVNWVHEASNPETRAVPTPEATSTVYRQIEQWLPMQDRETDNVLALTTRTLSAQHLQGFFQQSGRRANAETAVKVAGATAKHCVVLHGKSTFLSGTARGNDVDHECYTRANVAYSRATDLTVSVCPVNMQGTTGMSQVLAALLHGACTVYTNDQQTTKAFVHGQFPVKWKWVSESTADFLAAMEPQPLWNASLLVCLVEYHKGRSRRLRLVLTWQSYLTRGEKELLDDQRPVHGKIHYSGLLFGYAADRCTEPDWYVLPDGHLPDAWKLLHAARRGGDRFCVGCGARYAFGQASDAANKAKEYSFESLHKIYFYDAWRWIIELDQPDSPLRLPPRPGLLQKGCYWQRLPESNQGGGPSLDHPSSAIQAEVSLTETSSADGENNTSPSEAPEPASHSQEPGSPASPITIGSTEEEQAGSQNDARGPSASDSHVEIIVSASIEDTFEERRLSATPTSPVTKTAGKTSEQRLLTEEALAEETESGTTDEVIELEGSNEAMPARAAPNSPHSPQALTAEEEADTSRHQAGTKRSVPTTQVQEIENQGKPLLHPSAMSTTDVEGEGGHPCGSPFAPPTKVNTGSAPLEKTTRRSRWASSLPAVSTAPPQGVDPDSRSAAHRSGPTHPTSDTGEEVLEAPAPQAAAQPKMQEHLATQSKAPELTEQPQERASEREMIDALQSRLNVPPPPAAGLLSTNGHSGHESEDANSGHKRLRGAHAQERRSSHDGNLS